MTQTDTYPFLTRLFYGIHYLFPGGPVGWRGEPEARLRQFIEGPPELPAGRALDVGCGTGRHAIYLAKRGWKVVGVDQISKAIALTRRNVEKAGVGDRVRIVQGPATRLDELVGEEPFDLVVDVMAAASDLDGDQRRLYTDRLLKLTRPGTKLLLLSWLNEAEIRAAFEKDHEIQADPSKSDEAHQEHQARWYQLVRRA